MPLRISTIGKWWDNNPLTREQTDIDVVAGSQTESKLLLAECKWRNDLNEAKMIQSLQQRVGLIKGYEETYLAFFTKGLINKSIREMYRNNPYILFISVEDMFDEYPD